MRSETAVLVRGWICSPAPVDADDGGVDVHGAGIEVEHSVADGGGLADAHAGAEHELDQVGQVQSTRPRVAAQARLKVARFGGGQRTDLTVGAGDGSGVAHRVVWDGALADRVGTEAGQGAAGCAGWLWPVSEPELSERAVEKRRGEFSQPQFAERGLDVETSRRPVELPGTWGQRAGVEVGLPQWNDLAEPGTGRPLSGGEGGPLLQRDQEARPRFGLGCVPAGHRPVLAVVVAEPCPCPNPTRAGVMMEVDVSVRPRRQWWSSHRRTL